EGLGEEGAQGGLGLAAAERLGGLDAREHLLEHRRQERGLEGLGGLLDLPALGQFGGAARPGLGGEEGGRQGDGAGQAHHITSMSACRAPAALMVCRMEIMSRGVTPRAFSPATRLAREAPFFTVTNLRPFSSSTATPDCGTMAVWPWLNGAGWLTAGLSVTVMVR